MPRYVVSRLAEALDIQSGKALSRSRILILGLAYKRTFQTFAKARLCA